MKYTEILKLKKMLEDAKIPFKFIRREDFNGYHLIYPSHEKIICSVIEHDYSYGNASDLLEIKGLLTDEEAECNSVAGYLTAKEVFDRILHHYKKNSSAAEDRIKLKPCPFCGSKAEFHHCANLANEEYALKMANQHGVHCTNCYIATKPYDSEEEAAEAWNRRVE